MATESVDDLKRALKQDFNKLYTKEFTTDWEVQRLVRSAEIDVMSLSALQAYYTRECARKVLEGRIDTAQTALRACPTQDDKLRKWLEQHIVSIRAAIQEVGGV